MPEHARTKPAAPPRPDDPTIASDHRKPEEVREYESRVWDLTKHLIHPAFLYVVSQVALWGALEHNPAFRGESLSFWERTLILAIQFLGAWGVFYGTLLRDMRFQTRVVTIVLWLAIAGTVAAWVWPARESPAASRALWILLVSELVAGVAGWIIVMMSWARAKVAHRESGRG